MMKNKPIKTLVVFAALFVVFALAGCPQAHDDLLTLDEVFQKAGGIFIQAEDGTPHGSLTNNGDKGSGTVGKVMNELNNTGDGTEHYFTIKLPEYISSGSYTVNFRYASGTDDFKVKFTVNGGETVWETGVAPNIGWDLGASHDFIAPSEPVPLNGGDELKVWATNWGCIDYIKLVSAN
jgi:hypothetical protein